MRTSRPRYLTTSDIAAGRAVQRQSRARQARFAREFDPKVYRALKGWAWGRESFRLEIDTVDEPPSSGTFVLMTLEAIEYVAIKRDPLKGSQRAAYRHKHDAPYATIVTTRAGILDMAGERAKFEPFTFSPRNAPRLAGPALFALGDLAGLEGTAPDGYRLYWRAPPRQLVLVGDPLTDTMHVFRRGAARRDCAPIWIVRGRSPYRITDRGIDR